MHHIVYLSSAVGEMDEQALKALLLHSRRHNQQCGITGLLLFSEGNIMQVLEGEGNTVHALYRKIEQDCRHGHVMKIADGTIAHRSFGDWSMGFFTASPEEFAQLAGYHNLAATNFLTFRPHNMDQAIFELLREFAADNVQAL
ncbi:MAG TPA: BLUF domain-containing protein [Hymenobacter sp.]|nr:BLUF domain-containing protein [Hymenobacter sp.]